ncbi:hypothetical protein [Streptomyces sporangiiformans]|uniref:hypothetical protein n=1 Tax=Streptomyces sporangiiformans TaxID=2315329 RepID=UPI003B8A791C
MKSAGPAVAAPDIGAVDAVLLSHDQHPDNLDASGRRYLAGAPLVLSTASAYERARASAALRGGAVRGRTPLVPDGPLTLTKAFTEAELTDRLHLLEPGASVRL